MNDLHLGIDIGGTASRWVVCDAAGAEMARGRAGGATGHVFNPSEHQRLRAALTAIAEGLDTGLGRIASVTLGLTGFGAAVSAEVKTMLSDVFAVRSDVLVVTDDVALAYFANFAPGEGHLVSAGTGSIGMHVAADGTVTRVGGRGILIDDAGSGSWIALRALDRLYRVLDHSGSFAGVQGLADGLFAEIGGTEWSDVRHYVYAGDRGRIGALAVGVAAAAKAGDATALEILRSAGAELAHLAQALSARAGQRPAGFVGGVLSLHPVIAEEIRLRLGADAVRLLSGDAALAAARLQSADRRGWSPILAGWNAL